jgi:hypothetical protein
MLVKTAENSNYIMNNLFRFVKMKCKIKKKSVYMEKVFVYTKDYMNLGLGTKITRGRF